MRCCFMRGSRTANVEFLKDAPDDELIQQALVVFEKHTYSTYDGFGRGWFRPPGQPCLPRAAGLMPLRPALSCRPMHRSSVCPQPGRQAASGKAGLCDVKVVHPTGGAGESDK